MPTGTGIAVASQARTSVKALEKDPLGLFFIMGFTSIEQAYTGVENLNVAFLHPGTGVCGEEDTGSSSST